MPMQRAWSQYSCQPARPERSSALRAPLERHRIARHDVDVPPIAGTAALPSARVGTPKRVALVHGAGKERRLVSILRRLAAAAGARVEWSERAGAAGSDLTRALAESDAVIALALPRFRRGERALLPRFHSMVRAPSAFGSSAAPRSLRRSDLLLVGAVGAGAHAWERSVRLAADWAIAEGRRSLHCAVRGAGWPILASDRAARFRRIAGEHASLTTLRIGHHDTRRRLLFEPGEFEAIVADAGDVDTLATASCSGVGWSNRVPTIYVGDASTLVVLGDAAGAARGAESGETALAIALATRRLLRQLGELGAAERLGSLIAAELGARLESSGDLWLDLASETTEGFGAALVARLAERTPLAA